MADPPRADWDQIVFFKTPGLHLRWPNSDELRYNSRGLKSRFGPTLRSVGGRWLTRPAPGDAPGDSASLGSRGTPHTPHPTPHTPHPTPHTSHPTPHAPLHAPHPTSRFGASILLIPSHEPFFCTHPHHRKPRTLNPTPHTPHPTPHTLNPEPGTRDPTPGPSTRIQTASGAEPCFFSSSLLLSA